MTKSNVRTHEHYRTHQNDRILACDWCNDVELVVLVRKEDASVTIESNRQTVPVPDEWSEHISGLVAFSGTRLVVWPIERVHDEQCKIGVLDHGLWSTATIAAPLSLAANEMYLAVLYSEEWTADGADGSLFSDVVSLYEAGTLKRLSGVGPEVRKINDKGVVMEVDACCFDEQNRLYFVAYDTPYIWVYDVLSGDMNFDPMPVAPSYVKAITVSVDGIHLVVEDQSSHRIYSKPHGQMEWSDGPLRDSDVFSSAELTKATILGKRGGKLLAYTEEDAVILDLQHFQP